MKHVWFHLINITFVKNVISNNDDHQSLSSAQHCMTLVVNALAARM